MDNNVDNMVLSYVNDKKLDKEIKRLKNPMSILKHSTSQTTDPETDLNQLQKQFHKFVIESLFFEEDHDLLSFYMNLLMINPKFKPEVRTINKISNTIRFGKLQSDMESYSFIKEIQPDFHDVKMKNALQLFEKIYNSRIKDVARTEEFHNWVDDLIGS